jgi:hypothetical protein
LGGSDSSSLLIVDSGAHKIADFSGRPETQIDCRHLLTFVQVYEHCSALVLDLEAIREPHIGIRQRSAMVFARHDLAGEEVTNANIGNE